MTDLEQGDRVADRYVLIEPLGRGGSATTFLARDEHLDAAVTLKLLSSPELLVGFRAEFAHLSGLFHPHLMQVLDFGLHETDGRPVYFYSGRYVPGSDLKRFARNRRWEEVEPAIIDVLRALDFLHGLGLRHGDVKPGNIIVREDGHAVLIDLGCARPIDARVVQLCGTPGYLAPELVEGRGGRRADLFAVGRSIERLELSETLPPRIANLLGTLTAEDPSQRAADAAELLDLLGAAPDQPTSHGHAPRLLAREESLSRFERELHRLQRGEDAARLAWICGEQGVGKSRVLQEMKWRAQVARPTDAAPLRVVEARGYLDTPATDLLTRAFGGPALDLDQVLALSATGPVLLIADDVDLWSPDQRKLLWALLRNQPRSAPIAAVVASRHPAPPLGEHDVVVHELAPLGLDDIRGWLGDRVSPARLGDVLRLTGGRPAAVHFLSSQLSAGDCSEQDLERLVALQPVSDARLRDVAKLPPGPRDLLAHFCVEPHRSLSNHSPDERAALDALLVNGWVRHEGDGYALARPADAEQLRGAFSRERLRALHAERADELDAIAGAHDPGPAASLWARAIRHRARAAQVEVASAELTRARPQFGQAPGLFVLAAETLRDAMEVEPPAARRTRAAAYEAAGRGERTLEILDADDPQAVLLRASALFKLGRLDEVVAALAASPPASPRERAERADLLGRAQFKGADYEAAMRTARAGLVDARSVGDRHLEARLEGTRGLAACYLGQFQVSGEALARADALSGDADAPTRVRLIGYLGVDAYRRRDLSTAAEAYGRALELAESSGVSDLVASGALNLGTAQHLLGDWGAALESYERGRRVAAALGQTSTVVTLDFDLAKLYTDIGLFERALGFASRALNGAERAGLPFMAAAALSVRGEALLHQRDRGALASLRDARARFEAQGATRERLDVLLSEVEALQVLGDIAGAGELLERLVDDLESSSARDLQIRLDVRRAQLAQANDPEGARRRFAFAAEAAHDTGARILEATAITGLARVTEVLGDHGAAASHRAAATRKWQRMASALPLHLHDAFWSHPVRAGVEPRTVSTSRSKSRREDRYTRLLEINAQLNSSLRVDRVLSLAIDAAIELTGAERGFLLLADTAGRSSDPSKMRVAVARNLDRERIGRAHVKFSRSIAERVIHEVSPVFTLDASADARFTGERSVHDMRLKSVACVPVRSPDGVLGALYVDNRFVARTFDELDVELLTALADQVALALVNARLVAELEAERTRVAELLAEREREVVRLTEAARLQQSALESRYDYGQIAGRSAPMRQLLALLDRITESDISVLIEGESGTGKELVARALHFNGPRKKKPFVSLNCGALPDSLLESELFGHVKGAFTGATQNKTGLLSSAEGGTLFLDEIGEMSPAMQVRLLRALQERRLRPVGSTSETPFDVRVIGATNRRLIDEVAADRFREDLYYRLAVVEVQVPPLRDRIDDLPALVEHLLERDDHGASMSADALAVLARHQWPGNVRELENVLRRARLLAEGSTIRPHDLQLRRVSRTRRSAPADERERLRSALEAHDWNVAETGRALQIPRATLYRKLKRHGLTRPRDGG